MSSMSGTLWMSDRRDDPVAQGENLSRLWEAQQKLDSTQLDLDTCDTDAMTAEQYLIFADVDDKLTDLALALERLVATYGKDHG